MGGGTSYLLPHLWKEDEPYCFDPYKYDQQFGFKEPRREIVPTATLEEMNSANLTTRARDECAYYHIHYRGCIKYNVPFIYKCRGIQEELRDCYMERRIHDMKEFERERRLNARERRLKEAQEKASRSDT